LISLIFFAYDIAVFIFRFRHDMLFHTPIFAAFRCFHSCRRAMPQYAVTLKVRNAVNGNAVDFFDVLHYV